MFVLPVCLSVSSTIVVGRGFAVRQHLDSTTFCLSALSGFLRKNSMFMRVSLNCGKNKTTKNSKNLPLFRVFKVVFHEIGPKKGLFRVFFHDFLLPYFRLIY